MADRPHKYGTGKHRNTCVRCGVRRRRQALKGRVALRYSAAPYIVWFSTRIKCHPERRDTYAPRFEDGFEIKHCGVIVKLVGNMSLREAGAENTTLMLSCHKCHIQFYLADGIPPPSAEQLDLNDSVE